jgi:hypothetical protein
MVIVPALDRSFGGGAAARRGAEQVFLRPPLCRRIGQEGVALTERIHRRGRIEYAEFLEIGSNAVSQRGMLRWQCDLKFQLPDDGLHFRPILTAQTLDSTVFESLASSVGDAGQNLLIQAFGT